MPTKENKVDAILATEGDAYIGNKTECFSYKGEWAYAQ